VKPVVEVHELAEAPDVAFAARVVALNGLAQRILDAKAKGDTLGAAKLLAQFRQQLGAANLPALAAQAKAADMPSDFLLQLSSASDTLVSGITTALKSLPMLVALGIVAWVWLQSRGRGRHEW